MKAPNKMPAGALNPLRVAVLGVLALATFASQAPPAMADFAGGLGHTCWVSPTGGVECWGLNDAGQLGDGTTIDRAYPAPVYGLGPDPIFAVGTGEAFSCALSVVGTMYCWGDNAQGQLGDGTRIPSLEPIPVQGLGGTVESFSPGREHVCAVLSGNTAKCWGDNTTGQLGNGNFVDRLVPTAVAGLGGLVSRVASGYDHTCAVTITSDAFCWGQNNLGQLGDGTFIQRVQPTGVVGLSPSGTRIGFVAQIAAGEFHTCSTTPSGTVFCWGDNMSGQVGNVNLGTLHVFPSIVAGIGSSASQIEAGKDFTCVVDAFGGARCWGENMDGQLGDGTTVSRFSPALVSGFASGVTQIGLGDFHACADTSTGLRYCWGDSFFGQLGNGSLTTATVPIEVLEPEPVPYSLPAQIALGLILAGAGTLLAHRQIAGAR